MIYHITTPIEWKLAQERGLYIAPSLESEGFIHCSSVEQVIPVANAFYHDADDIILLCIDTKKLESTVKWEAPAHPEGHEPSTNAEEQQFPHIYGAINLDAVVRIVAVPKVDGVYHLPDELE